MQKKKLECFIVFLEKRKATKTRLNITDQELAQQHIQYDKMQRDKDADIKM